VGIKLNGAEIPTKGWPSVVQVIDNQVLANKLGYPVFPYQIELENDLPEGYKRDWQAAKIMLPEQHTAYAIQWFALAFTLTMLFFWYSLKK
jgi:surfeit locus 1 family protein